MHMTPDQMKSRTKAYALRVIKVVQSLPQNRICDILGGQLLRAGTSVGANYRSACRAKSPADFINKLKIVEEECDESLFWMELLVEAGLVKLNLLSKLLDEGNALLAITVASAKTARASNSRVNRKS
jgi:four helix bundle protein